MDYLKEKVHKARKVHKCSLCGKEIAIGEKCRKVSFINYNTPDTFLHEHCNNIYNEFRKKYQNEIFNEFLREDEKDINAHNRLKDALENLYCKLYYKSTEGSNENLDGQEVNENENN